MRTRELLIEAVRHQVPPRHALEDDPPAPCQVGIPGCTGRGIRSKCDGHDFCYGLAGGDFAECGSFTLSELQQVVQLYGTAPQRDPLFKPYRVSHLLGHVR